MSDKGQQLPQIYTKAVVMQPKGEHRRTVLFCHGLGDQGASFTDVFDMLQLKNTKVVLPNAPRRPITCNNGYVMPGWYDIAELGADRDLNSADNEDKAGILESVQKIHEFIDYEINTNNIAPENIIIGGFSQGSAISQLAAARYPKKIGGVVALSGYALLAKQEDQQDKIITTDTPYFVYHGVHDDIVPVKFARQSKDYWESKGIKIQYNEESGLGHSLSHKEIVHIKAFLKERNFE
eukprot:UN02691